MRWRIILSYLGTHYCGWQKQPGDPSVQQTLEVALSTILRQPVEITGCGRTDAGVHARRYVAHFDAEINDTPEKAIYQVNAVLPQDIAVHALEQAVTTFHARFDALSRTYRYYIHFEKNPFRTGQSFFFERRAALQDTVMHEAAALLLRYDRFKPFCKTGSDAAHFLCRMMESYWQIDDEKAVYTIRANRFLRGMVRLVVGAGLNAGLGKIAVDDLATALEEQTPLPYAWSAPPEGLFLEEVEY